MPVPGAGRPGRINGTPKRNSSPGSARAKWKGVLRELTEL